MNIVKTDSHLKLEHKQKKKNFISNVMDEIFAVCKVDKRFEVVKQKTSNLSEKKNILKKKTTKQENLILKSKNLTKEYNSKISIIDQEIFGVKVQLLEELGSEL